MKLRKYLLAKLHRIRVTEASIDYIGSVAIDEDFMDLAGITINEEVQIVDVDNGNRWTTYAIPATRGSKIMSLNGGGAYLGKIGDKLVVMTYTLSDEPIIPKAVFFGKDNEVLKIGTTEPHGTLHPDIDYNKV